MLLGVWGQGPVVKLWAHGKPTREGIDVFTCGNCWLLAWYLHRFTGWQLVLVGGDESEWNHAAVWNRHERLYLDVHGLTEPEVFYKRWSPIIVPVRYDTLAAYEVAIDPDYVDWIGVSYNRTAEQYRRDAATMAKRLINAMEEK
jgi:hypothetical protein